MKGIVFTGNRSLELREFPDPTPGPRDVILEIKASGMCGTDLRNYRAENLPDELFIGGHEPCGVVVAIGQAVTSKEAVIGDRMMVHHYDGCGICNHCNSGWTQLCTDDPVWYGSGKGHGAHAPYMKVAAHTLIRLPEELSFRSGAAIGCGTGTAYGAIKRMGLEGDETVTIFGQGPVGLSATQLAVTMGSQVIAVDPSAERRALAIEHGAIAALDPTVDGLEDQIRSLTHGLGAHKSIESSGAELARLASIRTLRTWGKTCFVGVGGAVSLNVSRDLIMRQISIQGHLTFSKSWLRDCATFILDRKINLDSLFSNQWRLDQAREAYELFDQQKTGKGVFLPN